MRPHPYERLVVVLQRGSVRDTGLCRRGSARAGAVPRAGTRTPVNDIDDADDRYNLNDLNERGPFDDDHVGSAIHDDDVHSPDERSLGFEACGP